MVIHSIAISFHFQTFGTCRKTVLNLPEGAASRLFMCRKMEAVEKVEESRSCVNILKAKDLGSIFSCSPISLTVATLSRVGCKFYSVWDLGRCSVALGLCWLVQNCPEQ